jgi:hypothetical protein
MWRKSKGVRFSFIVLAVLLALGLIGKMVSPSGDKPSYGVSSSAPVPQKPPLDETTIYAYALLKDPYTHKKHRVDFSPMSWPIIFNGQVSQYTEDHTGARMYASYTGLRFERMMSNGIALYNIMGKTADSTSPDLEFMGQLAVQLPPSITSLDTNKFWEVEPLGVASGTNAFGREITIPIIKFWDYTEVRVAAMSKPGPLTGDSLAAVNLVKSKIRPTKVLLSKQPNFSDSEWMPVNNQMLCDGCWFITYHIRVKHTAYADYVSGDWKVNLKSQSVTPLPETHKYFDTM